MFVVNINYVDLTKLHTNGVKMIGEKLKKIRKVLNITQDKMAELLGISARTYSAYERNENKPPYNMLILLFEKHNINLNWFIADKGEMFINECENTHALVDNPKCASNFKNWGERLCNLFAENNITPKSFAKLAGISASRMDDFIINSAEPTIAELNAIKSKADISIDELLYGESVNQQGNNPQVQFTQEEILKLKKLIGS